MTRQPFPLTPQAVRVLIQCPLHYHFRQQQPGRSGAATGAEKEQARLDEVVRERIGQLHAAGGPARRPLERCLAGLEQQAPARQMIERYYERLKQDWPQMMAGNETIELMISVGGVSLMLSGTVDRLDRCADGGIVAILFQTESGPIPTGMALRQDPAITIYHLLVAATYPLKRPVRIRQWWLPADRTVEVELSEVEYRRNLKQLREPAQALARGEVMARPGLHCDVCPFKYHGCPVYVHEARAQSEGKEFDPSSPPGKIPQRKWIFKI